MRNLIVLVLTGCASRNVPPRLAEALPVASEGPCESLGVWSNELDASLRGIVTEYSRATGRLGPCGGYVRRLVTEMLREKRHHLRAGVHFDPAIRFEVLEAYDFRSVGPPGVGQVTLDLDDLPSIRRLAEHQAVESLRFGDEPSLH